jgi:hypothetical protein
MSAMSSIKGRKLLRPLLIRREFAQGTYLEYDADDNFISGRALCSDGKVRKLRTISKEQDSLATITASVIKLDHNKRQKVISGKVMMSRILPSVLRFVASRTGINYYMLPED